MEPVVVFATAFFIGICESKSVSVGSNSTSALSNGKHPPWHLVKENHRKAESQFVFRSSNENKKPYLLPVQRTAGPSSNTSVYSKAALRVDPAIPQITSLTASGSTPSQGSDCSPQPWVFTIQYLRCQERVITQVILYHVHSLKLTVNQCLDVLWEM